MFEASIAGVVEAHVRDDRLRTALHGQGIIGTNAGPRDPGTAGSIAGALAFSLAFIPALGTRGCEQLLIWLAAASGVTALLSAGFRVRAGRTAAGQSRARKPQTERSRCRHGRESLAPTVRTAARALYLRRRTRVLPGTWALVRNRG